jgi:hypothetical protein
MTMLIRFAERGMRKFYGLGGKKKIIFVEGKGTVRST